MPGWQKISGGAAWSTQRMRSQGLREYRQANKGARPEAEFKKVGDKISIRTGARVTRARGRGVSWRRGIGRWAKNFGLLFGQGKKLALRNLSRRVRHAEHDFDKGVNRLVEDVANGDARSISDVARRLEALRGPAADLQRYGKASGAHIAERFETNLRESLEALEKADPEKAAAVRRALQNAMPALRQHLDLALMPRDSQRMLMNAERTGAHDLEAQKFATSLLHSMDRTLMFGNDPNVETAFSGSQLKYQAFSGSVEAMKAFDGSVAAHRDFGGDAGAYHSFGGCASLKNAFGDNLDQLKGREGATRLESWIDRTYGPGTGGSFMAQHGNFSNGIDSTETLRALGQALQNDLEPYRQKSYTPQDVTVDNVISGNNSQLRTDFDRLARKELSLENVTWLRDLDTAKQVAKTGRESDLRARVKTLARSIGSGTSLNVGNEDRSAFVKTVCEIAQHPYKDDMSVEDGILLLETMDRKQLTAVLDRGLAGARQATRSNVLDTLGRFGREKLAESVHEEREAAAYKGMINDRYGKVAGTSVGDAVFEQLRESDGRDRNKGLTEDDLLELDAALWNLPAKLNPERVKHALAQRSSNLPPGVAAQWSKGLDQTLHPRAEIRGSFSSKASGMRGFLDRRIDEAVPSNDSPAVSDQFMRDVDRLSAHVNTDNDSVRLTQDNSAQALKDLADGDETVALNLSKFAQQGAFNAAEGALALELGEGKNPVIASFDTSRSSTGEDKAVRIDISKDGDDFVLDYKWTPHVTGFSSGAKPVNTNADESGAVLTAKLRISAEDLRRGNLKNYELSDVNYQVGVELDPVSV